MKRFKIRLEELTDDCWRWWVWDELRQRMVDDGVASNHTDAFDKAELSTAKCQLKDAAGGQEG